MATVTIERYDSWLQELLDALKGGGGGSGGGITVHIDADTVDKNPNDTNKIDNLDLGVDTGIVGHLVVRAAAGEVPELKISGIRRPNDTQKVHTLKITNLGDRVVRLLHNDSGEMMGSELPGASLAGNLFSTSNFSPVDLAYGESVDVIYAPAGLRSIPEFNYTSPAQWIVVPKLEVEAPPPAASYMAGTGVTFTDTGYGTFITADTGKTAFVTLDTAVSTEYAWIGSSRWSGNLYDYSDLVIVVDVDWFYDSTDEIYIGGIESNNDYDYDLGMWAYGRKPFTITIHNSPLQLYSNPVRLQHNNASAGTFRFWSPTLRDVLLLPGQSCKATYVNGQIPHAGFGWPYTGTNQYWLLHPPEAIPGAYESAYVNGSYTVSGTGVTLTTPTWSPHNAYTIETLLVETSAGTTVSRISAPMPKVQTSLRVRNIGSNAFSFVEPTSMNEHGIYVRTNYANGAWQPVTVNPGEEKYLIYGPGSNSSAGAWSLLR